MRNKVKYFKILLMVLLAAVFAVSTVNLAFALSTADAKEPIDTSVECSIKLTFKIDSVCREGLSVEIYKAADVTSDLRYNMSGDFASYPVKVNGIKSQNEWDEVRDTLGAYIAADKIEPDYSDVTDSEGVVFFEHLSQGIYYVCPKGDETLDPVQGFSPFMIAAPDIGEDGKWIYDVEAFPKPGIIVPGTEEKLTLVKLWQDGSSDERPDTISVDIFRNGQLFESVELTAESNWTYTWTSEETYTWTAVERNVPEGYTVSVSSRDGNTIQITNTLEDGPTPPTPTGDTSNIYLWIILMAVSGALLILLGLFKRKKQEQ